jgi:hypothetical protein
MVSFRSAATAVLDGALDGQIEAAADSVKARFAK